jgi:hypothetical protein
VNYIKRLQKENKAKDAKIEALEEGLHSIESYLSLPKFREEYRFAGYEPPPEPEPRRPYLNSLRTDR